MLDFHSRNLFRLVRRAVDGFQPIKASELPHPYREASRSLDTTRVECVGDGVEVMAQDDDAEVRPRVVKAYLDLNNRYAPLSDRPQGWRSREEGVSTIAKTFGKYLPASEGNWSGLEDVTSHWMRQGLAAHRLERVHHAGEQEAFVARFEHMADFGMRDGPAAYGGDAYLNENGVLTRVHLGGQDVTPAHRNWEHAKFAFRTSSLVWATLSDHVFRTHFVLGNTFLISTKRWLPLDHPLRSLCAPFHYRTAAINNGGASTLVPEGGMFHRTTAFSLEGLQQVYRDCLADYRFETFPDELRRKGVHPDSMTDPALLYPYGADGLRYWDRVSAFVTDVLSSSPALRTILAERRTETQQWWDAQAALLPGGLPALDKDTLHDYLAHVMFTVTGFHSHVGNVAPYVRDPSVVGGKVWARATMSTLR